MKKILISLSLTAILMLANNHEKGVEAIEKGDYKTALNIFQSLAFK